MSSLDDTNTVVIVAARNEADRIGATITGLRASLPSTAVIVADDASADETASVAREAGAEVISTAVRRGKGGNVSAAAEEMLCRLGPAGQPAHSEHGRPHSGPGGRLAGTGGADPVVLLCDGDLGASASGLIRLVRAVEDGECDLAVAAFARRAGGGFGLARAAGRAAIKRRCGLETSAPLSGQRALRASVLSATLPFAPGFGMEVGMTIDAVRAGCRVAEVEVTLEHRATGRTLGGFAHRGRQLADIVRAYLARRGRS